MWFTGSKSTGSVAVAHGLSCSTAGGVFLDQGWNPCLQHWQADSQPLDHQESLKDTFLKTTKVKYSFLLKKKKTKTLKEMPSCSLGTVDSVPCHVPTRGESEKKKRG